MSDTHCADHMSISNLADDVRMLKVDMRDIKEDTKKIMAALIGDLKERGYIASIAEMKEEIKTLQAYNVKLTAAYNRVLYGVFGELLAFVAWVLWQMLNNKIIVG